MSDIIEKMRELLDELEDQAPDEEAVAFAKNFDALELPQLVADVVDYLQPHLHPYEAAVYWHLFRHSVLSSGAQHVRTSVRGLMEGVILSASGQSRSLSYASVQKSLAGLEEKEAIMKAGDTTREGTLYKIKLPEEIPLSEAAMREVRHEVEAPSAEELRTQLDYYNVRENRLKVFERDDYQCYYCEKQLTRFTASLDHIQPVSRGGDNSFENLVTACLHCNSRRGNQPVSEFLADGSGSDDGNEFADEENVV